MRADRADFRSRLGPGRIPSAGWLLAALLTGIAACDRSSTEPVPTDVLGQFDSFHRAFASTYPYFDYKHVNWAATGANYRPLAAQAPNTDSLVRILTAMVWPLNDIHLNFISPTGARLSTSSQRRASNFSQPRWQAAMTSRGLVQRAMNLATARFGDVGYLVIGAWAPAQFSASDLDAALEALRDTRALIVDVRANSGGDDQLAFALAGRFSAKRIAAGSVRYRDGAGLGALIERSVAPRGPWTWTKPVVLLIGGGCYSSSESFIAAMATLPTVTTLGDTTGGGSGNPTERALGGGWKYLLPRWIEYAPDGHVIEWQGIAPAVRVPFDTAGLAATRDPILEAALARLGVVR